MAFLWEQPEHSTRGLVPWVVCNTLSESHISKARGEIVGLKEVIHALIGKMGFGVYGHPRNKTVRALLRPKADNILLRMSWVMTLWYHSGFVCPLERWWGKPH